MEDTPGPRDRLRGSRRCCKTVGNHVDTGRFLLREDPSFRLGISNLATYSPITERYRNVFSPVTVSNVSLIGVVTVRVYH